MAGYPVTGDQYRTIDRRMREIQRQLDQEGGSPLDPEGVARTLQLILEGDLPRQFFKRDMRKESGWTLEKEGPAYPASIVKPTDLELVAFVYYGEQSVVGAELERRATKLGADLGQHTAEWLLDHKDEIPEEWRRYYLVFPGSVWQDSLGRRRVPDLCWGGARWYLYFPRLGPRFPSGGRLVQPRK